MAVDYWRVTAAVWASSVRAEGWEGLTLGSGLRPLIPGSRARLQWHGWVPSPPPSSHLGHVARAVPLPSSERPLLLWLQVSVGTGSRSPTVRAPERYA